MATKQSGRVRRTVKSRVQKRVPTVSTFLIVRIINILLGFFVRLFAR